MIEVNKTIRNAFLHRQRKIISRADLAASRRSPGNRTTIDGGEPDLSASESRRWWYGDGPGCKTGQRRFVICGRRPTTCKSRKETSTAKPYESNWDDDRGDSLSTRSRLYGHIERERKRDPPSSPNDVVERIVINSENGHISVDDVARPQFARASRPRGLSIFARYFGVSQYPPDIFGAFQYFDILSKMDFSLAKRNCPNGAFCGLATTG